MTLTPLIFLTSLVLESDDQLGVPLYSRIKIDTANSLNQYLSSDESFGEFELPLFKSEY
ncbi:MAG: hypothetical protein KBT66_16350 [Amphritea sp.]|nr:hypothetical protein [Amphritea sp.]